MGLKVQYRRPILTLCDGNYNRLGILSNKTQRSCYNVNLTKKVNEVSVLSFDIPSDNLIDYNSTELLVKFGLDYYIIKDVTLSSTDKSMYSVSAEHESTELKGILVSMISEEDSDTEIIGESPEGMWSLLVDSCSIPEVIKNKYIFETDIVDTYRSLEVEDEKGLYEHLVNIAKQFEACLVFEHNEEGKILIKLIAGEIDNKRVVKKGKDLRQLNITLDSSAIFTKIIPFGAVDKETGLEINIMDVTHDGKSYITNYDYYLDQGMTLDEIKNTPKCNQECIYRNSDIVDVNELLRIATKELEQISKPVLHGNIDIINLGCMEGYFENTPVLCERIYVADKVGKYNIFSKVVGVSINYDNPLKSKVEISNVVRYSSTFADIVRTSEVISKVTTKKKGKPVLSAERVQGIIDAHTTQIKNKLLEGAEHQGDKTAILFEDERVDSDSYGAIALGTSGILISNEKDINGEWLWTTAIDSQGLSTKIVNAITINGAQVNAGIISSFDGSSWWNLDNNEFNFGDKIKFIDGTFSIELGNDLGNLVTKEDLEEVKDLIEEVDGRLDTALGDIDRAFKEGIIGEVEKSVIEKTLKTLLDQYSNAEYLYEIYKVSENLTDETKTTLNNRWRLYDSAYTELTNYINEIIADGKCTETELVSYNLKVEEYYARYSELKNLLEDCQIEASNNYTNTKVSISEGNIRAEIESQYVKVDEAVNYTVICDNEHQGILVDQDMLPLSNTSYRFNFTVYKGSSGSSIPFTIESVSGTGTGLTYDKGSNYVTMATSKSSMLSDEQGSITVTIKCENFTFTKKITWSAIKRGKDGENGENGADAEVINIATSTQVFKSADGGITYTPASITVSALCRNATFSKWQYSTNNDLTFRDLTNGVGGITVTGMTLSIPKTCSLFTSTSNCINIKAVGVDENVYDTVTIFKLLDRADINDVLDEQNSKITTVEEKYSTLEQDLNGFKTEVGQKYTTLEEFGQLEVGATNLIRNANFDLGLDVYWNTWNITNDSVTLLSPENDKPTSNILAYNVTGNTSPTYIQKWSNPIPIEWDKEVAEFIFRFEVKSENWNIVDDEGVLCCARTFVNSDKTTTGIIEEFSVSKSDIDTTNNGWQTVVKRIRVTNNTAKYIRFGSYCSQNSNCKFREFMAVKGNRIASTFSINPSDTKEYVDGEILDYTQTITREYQSAIEQTKNDITLSVSSTYVTKTEIEQMVIGGGDNLLRNGNFEYDLKHWSVEDYDTIGTEKGIRVIDDNSTGVPKGKHLLQISGVNTNNYYGVMSDEITLSNYTSYVLSGYCAGNNVNHISVIIRAVTETGSTDIIHKEYTPKAGGTNLNDWERFEIPFTTTGANTYVVSILSHTFDNDNKGYVWFTDVQLEQGNKATPFRKCPLDVSEEVDEVQDSVTNLNDYINGALEDKILDKTERQAIEQQLKTLEAEKADIDKEYTALNSNAKLTGTPKTTLTSAYNDYISKYNALVTSINNILDAEDITVALKNSYNTAYTNHNNSLATYRQAYIDAFNSITTNYIETMKQALSEEIDEVQDSVDNLNTYVDGAFKDGILSDAEKQAIREQLKVLTAEKADIDNEYAVVINDSDLNGEPKTNLANAYNDYVSKYNALVTSINNILNSTFIILTLREFYDTAYTNHNNALATLKQRHVEAINAIAEAKKQTSITTSKNYTDAQLTTTADAIRGTVSQLREDFEGLEIGGENLLKNSEFITTSMWTIPPTVSVTIDTSNRCFDSNSMKISSSNALFENYAKFSQTFAENVSIGQKFAVSGYYYVDNASLLEDKTFSISLKGKTGSQNFVLKDISFDKTNCKVKQWTKFSFTTTVDQDYDSASLTCSLGKNGEVWFSRLQVEEGDRATSYSPASTTYATKSEMELTSEEFRLTFQKGGSGNLLKNSDCQFGLNGQWVNNGGGLAIDIVDAKPFYGGKEFYFKTSFSGGIKYSEAITLKPNTDYVYQAYVYVSSTITEDSRSPMHFWTWFDVGGSEKPGAEGITILDYSQTLTVGEFTLCYVHFKTDNVTSNIMFKPFIYNEGTVSLVGVKQICLKEGKTPSIWIPHSSEINEGITTINEDGIQVSHSNISTKTRMTADGFYFLDENDDIFASLSSKDTWASLRVQEVFANNIENIYTGDANLYVNHSKTSAGDGSFSSPFNSFGVLQEYLQSMPIINKDLEIHVQNPNMEINEQLSLSNLKGTGWIKIVFDKNCVLRSNEWAISLNGINKFTIIEGGRSSYSSSDGAVILDKGNQHGISINDCKDVYIHSININCKNWGIRANKSKLRTRNIDFGQTWCAIELNENCQCYDGDSCGNCGDFVRAVTGSIFTYGSSANGICPFGNKVETSGRIFLVGKDRSQAGSYKYPSSTPPPATPTTATYTQTFKATSFKTYQYAWSNWGDGQAGGAIQGAYGG